MSCAAMHRLRFTKSAGTSQMALMDWENPVVWIVVGVIALIALTIIGPRFSAEARLGRRRRRSNARVVSKSRSPSVKFSVHTKEEKK